jgi:NADP-dependent 3-hydroxy acid dehydrogenase YdfG
MRAAFTVTKAVLSNMTEKGSGRIVYLSAGPAAGPGRA